MDIRRTILWMIFSFSLLLLWNNWQMYQGQPSLFSVAPPATEASKTASGADAPAGTPAGQTGVPTAAVGSTSAPANVPSADTIPQGQPVHVKTDVYDLTFDTHGAQLIRAELLKYKNQDTTTGILPWFKGLMGKKPGQDPAEAMFLLNNQPGDTYVAQTGLVGAPQGDSYPTHLTPFTVVGAGPVVKDGKTQISFEATSGQAHSERRANLSRDCKHRESGGLPSLISRASAATAPRNKRSAIPRSRLSLTAWSNLRHFLSCWPLGGSSTRLMRYERVFIPRE